MKGLYHFLWDCGKMGVISGMFIATSKEVKNLIGKELHFGDVLGKHSDISGVVEKKDIVQINIPKFCLLELELEFEKTICGYNPFDALASRDEPG